MKKTTTKTSEIRKTAFFIIVISMIFITTGVFAQNIEKVKADSSFITNMSPAIKSVKSVSAPFKTSDPQLAVNQEVKFKTIDKSTYISNMQNADFKMDAEIKPDSMDLITNENKSLKIKPNQE